MGVRYERQKVWQTLEAPKKIGPRNTSHHPDVPLNSATPGNIVFVERISGQKYCPDQVRPGTGIERLAQSSDADVHGPDFNIGITVSDPVKQFIPGILPGNIPVLGAGFDLRDCAPQAREQYWCPRSHDAQITTFRWHRPQVNKRPVSRTRLSQERVDPGTELPDNRQEPGHHDRFSGCGAGVLAENWAGAASLSPTPLLHPLAGNRAPGSGPATQQD